MTWVRRHRLRAVLQTSIWVLPLASMVAALLIAPAIRAVDDATRWTLLGYTPNGARTLLGALVASAMSFVVFTFSILLVAIQISSGTLSPRVIASFLADREIKLVLTTFVFTFTYAAVVLGRIEDRVPQLSMLVALVCSLLSIAAFLFLIDHSARGLRPVAVVERVALDGQRVIEQVYPRLLGEAGAAAGEEPPPVSRTIVHAGRAGVLLAMDVEGLVAAAGRAAAVVTLVPQVGEFVVWGEPLFHVAESGPRVDDGALQSAVAFGPARTLEQDPAFVFRVLVDVAAKALSPAVNDPTTAVQAIHQIQRLLRIVGTRDLSTGRVRDAHGRLRLAYRTPDWDDFVALAVTEIRLYGASSIQVPRRLIAMLERLIALLPPVRHPALREHLSLVVRSAERTFKDLEDRRRAETPDVQGVGGAR